MKSLDLSAKLLPATLAKAKSRSGFLLKVIDDGLFEEELPQQMLALSLREIDVHDDQFIDLENEMVLSDQQSILGVELPWRTLLFDFFRRLRAALSSLGRGLKGAGRLGRGGGLRGVVERRSGLNFRDGEVEGLAARLHWVQKKERLMTEIK